MREPTVKCQVFEGLCNRLNCIASALATGRRIRLYWAVNQHCPVRFEELFCNLDNVDVVNQNVEHYRYAASRNRICWFYVKNVDQVEHAVFHSRILYAYRHILDRLRRRGHATPLDPALGIVYRHHHRDADYFEHFWAEVEEVVQACTLGGLHVTCDSQYHKEILIERLASLGKPVTVNESPLLSYDLDRSHSATDHAIAAPRGGFYFDRSAKTRYAKRYAGADLRAIANAGALPRCP